MWGLICYPLQCKGDLSFMNTFLILLGIVYFIITFYSMFTIASIYSCNSVSLMDPGPKISKVIEDAFSSGSIYSPFTSSYRSYYPRYGLIIFIAVWICFLMIPEVVGVMLGSLYIGIFKLISKPCYMHKEG